MKTLTDSYFRKFNFIMAALHGLQAIVILFISKSFSITATGSFLEFNQSTQSLQPATTGLFDISVPLLVAGFFMMSS